MGHPWCCGWNSLAMFLLWVIASVVTLVQEAADGPGIRGKTEKCYKKGEKYKIYCSVRYYDWRMSFTNCRVSLVMSCNLTATAFLLPASAQDHRVYCSLEIYGSQSCYSLQQTCWYWMVEVSQSKADCLKHIEIYTSSLTGCKIKLSVISSPSTKEQFPVLSIRTNDFQS